MLVREAMAPHAEWISPDISLAEAGRKMRDNGIGCLPVGENDRLIGMITDRDLVCRGVAEGMDCNTAKAHQVMTRGITWCFEDESCEDAVQRMEEKQIHHMPVLNRQKRIIGILSLSDLALRGPKNLYGKVSTLAARDARLHAKGSTARH
ncbi:CBS domain-containing protein [Inquilinus limosus]|uniref:CBS domain-containing protein n=1 Tax=Inquilinus limosus TaxID=171674 RepID=UPI003F5CD886